MLRLLFRPRPATATRVLLVVAAVLSPRVAAGQSSFALDYGSLTVLPSAAGQGLSYVTGSYLGLTEAQAVQVTPGRCAS